MALRNPGTPAQQLDTGATAEILCYDDAFSDIIHHTTPGHRHGGLAVAQSWIWPKPVLIQIPWAWSLSSAIAFLRS